MQFRKANGSVYEKELFIKLGKLLLNLESDFFFFFSDSSFLKRHFLIGIVVQGKEFS